MEFFLQGSKEASYGSEENYSLTTCAVRGQAVDSNTSLPVPFALVYRVSHAVYFSIFTVVGMIINLLVVFLVMRSKKLKNRSFVIAFQIILTNLGLIAVFGIPSMIQYSYCQLIWS